MVVLVSSVPRYFDVIMRVDTSLTPNSLCHSIRQLEVSQKITR